MNIFVLDADTELCAQYHCDKHVVKMVLEYAQLLSTAARSTGLDIGYKATHINHPCTKWARASLFNYAWLLELSFFLNEEYKFRYNHSVNHKAYDVIQTLPFPIDLPKIPQTPFALAMPDEYKDFNDSVLSYRTYYVCEKAHILSYTKRSLPLWI